MLISISKWTDSLSSTDISIPTKGDRGGFLYGGKKNPTKKKKSKMRKGQKEKRATEIILRGVVSRWDTISFLGIGGFVFC